MIAAETSPLKQRARQRCRAFSLWGVHRVPLLIVHLLLRAVPQMHVMCIMGADGFQARAGAVGAESHLVQTFLAEFTVKVGHLPHVLAEAVCPRFLDFSETLLQHFV